MQQVDTVDISRAIRPSGYDESRKLPLPPGNQGVSPSPEHVRIVQSTWLEVLPSKDITARRFYDRLFEMDASFRDLFPGDMSEQCEELVLLIDAAVKGLSRLPRLVPAVQELGRCHASTGINDDHYAMAGDALVWALGNGLGTEFTPDVKEAWTAVYGVLATTMRDAAAAART